MQRFVRTRSAFPLVILMLAGIGGFAFVASATTTYNDPKGRFAFAVPDGYVQRFRAGTDAAFRSITTQTSGFDVTVVAQVPDAVPDADTIAANTLKGLKAPVYAVGDTGVQTTLLGGQSARKFDYFTMLEGTTTRTHSLEIIAVTSKAAYVLVFSATEGDYNGMLNDTALALGSFVFSSAGAAGSVTTGSSTTTGTPATMSDLAAGPPAPTTSATFSSPATAPSVAMPNANLSNPPPITTPQVLTGPVFTISTPTPVLAPTDGAKSVMSTVISGSATPAFTISTPTAVLSPATGPNTVTNTGTFGSATPVFVISTPTVVLAPATGATAATATALATAAGKINGIATFAPQAPIDNAQDRT